MTINGYKFTPEDFRLMAEEDDRLQLFTEKQRACVNAAIDGESVAKISARLGITGASVRSKLWDTYRYHYLRQKNPAYQPRSINQAYADPSKEYSVYAFARKLKVTDGEINNLIRDQLISVRRVRMPGYFVNHIPHSQISIAATLLLEHHLIKLQKEQQIIANLRLLAKDTTEPAIEPPILAPAPVADAPEPSSQESAKKVNPFASENFAIDWTLVNAEQDPALVNQDEPTVENKD